MKLKTLLFSLICLFVAGCDFESNERKCNRIVSVVAMTVCADYANTQQSYYQKGWHTRQSCFNTIKNDFMDVCKEQIKKDGEPNVIRILENHTGIKTDY